MAKQRQLTAGEIALARECFGNSIPYESVKISDGPARNGVAIVAFQRGNPAITLGTTIYFERGYSEDFSQQAADKGLFMHEMTHVWQYRQLGTVKFLRRYLQDLAATGFKPSRMYDYAKGTTRYGEAMLEAQANMVRDYCLARGDEAGKAVIGRNLAGSGLYGKK